MINLPLEVDMYVNDYVTYGLFLMKRKKILNNMLSFQKECTDRICESPISYKIILPIVNFNPRTFNKFIRILKNKRDYISFSGMGSNGVTTLIQVLSQIFYDVHGTACDNILIYDRDTYTVGDHVFKPIYWYIERYTVGPLNNTTTLVANDNIYQEIDIDNDPLSIFLRN